MAIQDNLSKPAPRWFRITKKIVAYTENTVLGFLLINGHGEGSQAMLYYKLGSSFVMNILESILSNGQEYAPAGATEALQNVTNLPVEQAIKKNT